MAYGEQLGIECWRNKLFWWVIRLQVMMRIRRLARLCVGRFAGVGGANRWVLNLFLRTFDVGKRLMDSVFVGR